MSRKLRQKANQVLFNAHCGWWHMSPTYRKIMIKIDQVYR